MEAHWSARYREVGDDYLFGMEPNKFLAQHADLFSPGQTALSIADGEGRNSVWLAKQGLVVNAIEISPVAVAKAHKLSAARAVAVKLEIGDILAPNWPPPAWSNHFDWVVGIFVQFVGPLDRQRQFAAMKTVARPGGRIFLHGYTPKQLEYRTGGPSELANLYTPELLRGEFSDWTIEELVEYEDDINEGSRHCGKSALIGMVAMKKG